MNNCSYRPTNYFIQKWELDWDVCSFTYTGIPCFITKNVCNFIYCQLVIMIMGNFCHILMIWYNPILSFSNYIILFVLCFYDDIRWYLPMLGRETSWHWLLNMFTQNVWQVTYKVLPLHTFRGQRHIMRFSCPATCQLEIIDKCDTIKGNESLVENFNFYFLTPLSQNFKMLHFDANPIIRLDIWLLELWGIWQC